MLATYSRLFFQLRVGKNFVYKHFQETSSSKTKYEHEIARIKAVLGQLQHENRELRVHYSQANNTLAVNEMGGGGSGDKDAFNAFR